MTDDTPSTTPTPPARADQAFGNRNPLAALLGALLPLAALGVAWWLTRDRAEPAPAASGHDHMAMVARDSSGGGGRMVMLTGEQARRIGVTFAPVTRLVMPREVRTVGQVTVDETRVTAISPRVDGWVEQLMVDFTGRSVRRGEPLMRIYSPMIVAAQDEYLLARRLAGNVAAGTIEAREGASELVAAARNRLVQWEVPEEEITRLERTGRAERTFVLPAPASGVVVEKNVVSGQRIMAGDALYRIADLGTVWLEGEVYEQDLRAVRTGQVATAEFDAWPGERWTGRIAWIAPTLSPETRTARIRVLLANASLRLKPGMAATLSVTGVASGTSPVLVVPRNAVLVTGERSLVFIKRADGRLEPRTVTVGATTHESIEILRGVALGDTVVASATFLIDAESNLGTALGGMGDMPGMEITMPPTAAPAPRAPDTTRTRKEE